MVTKLDARGICRRLLDAESEADVQTVIDSVPEMANPKNWRPLDNRETNFNVTSNQASDGGKALTELMTNMVDAMLMKHALLKGIDPKSSKAPAKRSSRPPRRNATTSFRNSSRPTRIWPGC